MWIRIKTMAGSCEDGNEPSGSIKNGEFPDQLSEILGFQGLRCMELVTYLAE